MEITKKYFINGPNNVIRLTNGTKIIYIFGDIHLDVDNQNKCVYDKNVDSINFDQFIIKFMKENTKDEYDLFIEQTFDQLTDRGYNDYNHIYLNNVRNIFSKNIKFDKNKKIIKSEKYLNYRFHYFDFRDDFQEFIKIKELIYELRDTNLLENINIIINILVNIKLNIDNFNKLINEKSKHKIIKKLYLKYENVKIQKQILYLINTYFKNYFYHNINNTIDDLLDYLYTNYDTILNKYLSNDFKLELIFEIIKKIDLIDNLFYDIFQLSDIYLIRRILDKKYNKKSIVYTGLAHLSLITYFLVKYFDFKITHIYYLSDEIKNVEDYIKKGKNYNNLINYLLNINEKDEIIQCINLFDFPINMS